MNIRKILYCCLLVGGLACLSGGTNGAPPENSADEELFLPGLEEEEESLPGLADDPPVEKKQEIPEGVKDKIPSDSVSPAAPAKSAPLTESEEIVLPGLSESESESEPEPKSEPKPKSADPVDVKDDAKDDVKDDAKDDAKTSAFEKEDELPKDGAEWENWEGWDKIPSALPGKKDSSSPKTELTREAAMEEADRITDHSETMDENALPEVNDQLDASAHPMVLSNEKFNVGAPASERDALSDESDLPTKHPASESDASEYGNPVLPPTVETSDDNLPIPVIESEVNRQPDTAEPGNSGSLGDSEESGESAETDSRRQAEELLDAIDQDERVDAPFSDDAQSDSRDEPILTDPRKANEEQIIILTPEIRTLLDRIKAVRKAYGERPVQTDNNTPYEALMSVWAFGCQANVLYMPDRVSFNAAAALCWNYPMGELPTLSSCELEAGQGGRERTVRFSLPGAEYNVTLAPRRVFPLTGYCQQERPGDLLAALAMARVPPNYQFKLEGVSCSIGDLADTESLFCVGGDMSAQLIAMAYYRPRDKWINQFGQKLDVEKIVHYEMRRRANRGSSDATERLFGLTFALRRRLAFAEIPLEKNYVLVDEYIKRFSQFALDLQNADGSWHGQYFMRKGKSVDPDADFAATGNIARWLALAVPSSRLDDPKILAAVQYLTTELEKRENQFDPAEQSQSMTKGFAYALLAIGIFQERWE